MELPPVIIFEPGKHDYLIPAFAFIHEDCIETDFTLATFQPPFQHQNPEVPDPRVLKYWSNNAAKVTEDTKVMFMQMAISESGHEELAGYVVLASQASETGPFRGSVEKLLVSPRYRRRGIARLLMSKLEEVARVRGTTLLVRTDDCFSRGLAKTDYTLCRLSIPRLAVLQRGFTLDLGTLGSVKSRDMVCLPRMEDWWMRFSFIRISGRHDHRSTSEGRISRMVVGK
jgi:GNAT superfamily N-acetyltransferase